MTRSNSEGPCFIGLGGADAAKRAITRGLEVAGAGRQMVLPEVVAALLDVGAADEALVHAKKVGKRRRCEMLAEVYLRTEAWAPLAALLAPVDDPVSEPTRSGRRASSAS